MQFSHFNDGSLALTYLTNLPPPYDLEFFSENGSTLSEAIGSLGCIRNSPSGSVLIRQLTELQLMTSSRSVESASFEHLNLPCI